MALLLPTSIVLIVVVGLFCTYLIKIRNSLYLGGTSQPITVGSSAFFSSADFGPEQPILGDHSGRCGFYRWCPGFPRAGTEFCFLLHQRLCCLET